MSYDIGNIYYNIDTNVDLMCSIQNVLPIYFNIIIYVFCLILSYIVVVKKQKYKLK